MISPVQVLVGVKSIGDLLVKEVTDTLQRVLQIVAANIIEIEPFNQLGSIGDHDEPHIDGWLDSQLLGEYYEASRYQV